MTEEKPIHSVSSVSLLGKILAFSVSKKAGKTGSSVVTKTSFETDPSIDPVSNCSVEHNLDVMSHSDWIIDLGPEGGYRGGYILATGTPEQIAALEDNVTGTFLRQAVARQQN